jgi:hypothetical protein
VKDEYFIKRKLCVASISSLERSTKEILDDLKLNIQTHSSDSAENNNILRCPGRGAELT